MTQFWIAALALGLVAAAFVLVPVVRAWTSEQSERSSTALGVGIVVALAVPVVAVMLYARWTTWDWATGGMQAGTQDAGMHEMDQALKMLEQRLAQNPEDIEGWMLLGRSYMSMSRFDQAARAYRRAAALDGNENVQILADLGEALALSDPDGLQGEAGAIFERVLAKNPSHPKGLWYGGLNAYENFDWALAEQRLGLLLTLNPPESIIPLIEERIAAARAHLGEAGEAVPTAMATPPASTEPVAPPAAVIEPPAAEPTQGALPAGPAAGPAAAAVADESAPAEGGIRLEVTIDPTLAAQVPGQTPVFIIARTVAGAPPLAVIRTTSAELPLSVTLTDANAMMEGVTLLDQPELELIARVSLSGSPAQRPGDLFGAVNYSRGNSGVARIRIDRIAE
jgi:cytochrome c-type biogenesis protein CcmH